MTATYVPEPLRIGSRVMHMRTGTPLRLNEDESPDSATVWATITSGPRRGAQTNVQVRDVLPLGEAMLQLATRAATCAHELDRPDLVEQFERCRDHALDVLIMGQNGPSS